MDDEKAYRSRKVDSSGRQQRLSALLARLESFEHATDPTQGQSAVGKDHKAFAVLLRANALLDEVVGWAIDHVYGLSLAGIRMLPRQPSASQAHPDYEESRRLSDVHNHELEGGQWSETKPSSPEARRLILRNLVFAGAGGFPPWLRDELLEALDALDNGTVMPLLDKAKRSGTDYAQARARLRIVAFVKFRSHAYSVPEEEARAIIGGTLGRSAEALKSWEQRLKESCLGPLEVHRQIAFALSAAGHVRAGIEQRARGECSEDVQSLAASHEEQWSAAELASAVAAWREAEGL